MKSIKAVTPIIAVITLLVIATGAAIAYNNWFSPFAQEQIVDSSDLDENGLKVLNVNSNNILFVRNFLERTIVINNVTIGDTGCAQSITLNASQINTINVTTCVNGNPSGTSQQSVSVITDNGVFKEKLVIVN